MQVDRDLLARVGMAVGCIAGAAGLAWGVTESHAAALNGAKVVTVEHKVTVLEHQHRIDLHQQQEENAALSGAVLYVEESIAAVCASSHANCPRPPGAVP